ncbi:hypothetical protein TPHA_0A04710 [Tetrapisispora phaffii CBS 4417]|uniref:MEMO1 family protein n=1 Tax=Tetrapisispora phaffii (strain ATCC 24235 / CBS 4417 / NBRC 1672 / NRRL Y-8282 / UCD 70-5) TaxID=1071381 RepID=G8BNR8_TETPH|nr:hypothetical protein TPHA_0A04710 [Tetrapisispora phaffii CBS 4417]CCE61546.1 hypothetical protein TPHA_0A04710 [Tetrapisispora phaffii CBS 4417]
MSRPATHSGSWYSDDLRRLDAELSRHLVDASKNVNMVKGSRLIISPHAGYKYCGSTMAYSYASLDLNSNVKRIIIMGPSHHIYFKNQIYVSGFSEVQTPLGNLHVDKDFIEDKLMGNSIEKGLFAYMDEETDLSEHSLEMQFPMVVKTLQFRNIDVDKVKVVPMIVSHNSEAVDTKLANVLKNEFMNPETIFIVSSDFCHWGRRFQYTGYVGNSEELKDSLEEQTEIEMLTSRSKSLHREVKIWESIMIIDKFGMKLLSDSDNSDKYKNWKNYIEISGNTVCGTNPIKVILKTIELIANEVVSSGSDSSKIDFYWPSYSQSSKVTSVNESSVSYASGYAII